MRNRRNNGRDSAVLPCCRYKGPAAEADRLSRKDMRTQRHIFSDPACLAVLTGLFLVLACLSLSAPVQAQGQDQTRAKSWLIDEERFARSAHADQGCPVCHEAMTTEEHPLPDGVFKEGPTPFDPATCFSCHPDVEEELGQGLHAGKPVPAGTAMNRCAACHDPHGPDKTAAAAVAREIGEDSLTCLSCHGTKAATTSVQPKLCLACHETGSTPTHQTTSCLTCHTNAAAYPHTPQEKVNCLSCHVRHTESVIHDAHSRVSCTSCHSAGMQPVAADGQVIATAVNADLVHTFDLPAGTASCVRCHTEEPKGAVLAASSVLPPKSVLCAACHAATFTVQDTSSQLGLGVFLLGFAGLALIWLWTARPLAASSGRQERRDSTENAAAKTRHEHGPKGLKLVAQVLGDIVLQARLWRENRLRWVIHALIFFPFVVRAGYGLIASLGAWLAPKAAWPWLMLDKDWPLTALVNDTFGLLLLTGLVLALWQEYVRSRAPRPDNAPKPEWLVLILLLALTLTGFVLEGARIALDMLALGSEAGPSFAGAFLAQLFLPLGAESLASLYGTLWYLHAIVTAVTVACIPFTRLRHVVTAPIFLIVQALQRK